MAMGMMSQLGGRRVTPGAGGQEMPNPYQDLAQQMYGGQTSHGAGGGAGQGGPLAAFMGEDEDEEDMDLANMMSQYQGMYPGSQGPMATGTGANTAAGWDGGQYAGQMAGGATPQTRGRQDYYSAQPQGYGWYR